MAKRLSMRVAMHARLAGGLLALLSAGAASAAALPETPLFESFGTAEGLPASKLYALAQDRQGFLWIGSIDGLARYDGLGFEVFRHDSRDPHSLAANNVQALHVDARGRLWLAAEGAGISVLEDPRSGRFRHFGRSHDPRIEADDVFAITDDAEGALWFGGFRTGLLRLDPEGGDVQVHRHDPAHAGSLAADTVLSLLRTRDGALWIGTTAGLCRQLREGFECLRLPAESVRGQWVWSLAEAEAGGLYVGSVDALWLLQPAQADQPARFEAVPGIAAGSVAAVLDEGGGHLWVGQSSGLSSRQDQDWHRHTSRPGQRFAFPGQVVTAILRDHEQGLWFATDGGGLARLPPGFRDFSVFRHQPEHSGALPLGMAPARDGGLWLVGQSPTVEHLDLAQGALSAALRIEGLPGTKLRSVLELEDGSLWLGHSDGLVIRRPDGSEQRLSPSSPEPVPIGELDHLLATQEGVWVGVVGAALQLRSRKGDRLLDLRGDGDGGLDSVETEQLIEAADGALWWSGAIGLRRRAAGGLFERIEGAPQDRVYGIAFESPQRLWLHRVQGLERYAWDGRRLQLLERVGAASGLPEVESSGPILDRSGDLWLPTIRGLFRYRAGGDSGLAELRQFGQRHGLPSTEFRTRQRALLTPEGRFVGLTLGGVVAFDPARLDAVRAASPLHWHSASVLRGGERVELDGNLLELQHDDRDLRLSLRLLSFADPATHRYRFRLQDLDPGWIEVGPIAGRSYAQLPPGDYVLQAGAATADGRWVSAPERHIHVHAPPWRQPWAYLAYALMGLMALLLAIAASRRRLRSRMRIELAEQARQQALAASEAKGRFLATLGHEVRTPMAGLLGMNALLLESPLQPEQRRQALAIRRAARMMLRLLNEALDLARIEAGRLELLPQDVDLVALLAELIELEQPLADSKGLRLQLAVAPQAELRVQADPLRLQQILLNLLGNAIKFTEQGGVSLSLERVAAPAGEESDPGCARLRFCVEDSGRGLDADALQRLFQPFVQAEGARTAQQHGGSGLGLLISRQLAEAMGGSLRADSRPGQGSRFVLELDLPILGRAEDAPAAAPGPGLAPARGGGSARRSVSVLLVEDHPDVAEALAGLLRRWGCEVQVAPHGLQALALVEQQPFELGLFDLDLPGLDGFELARLLRDRLPRLIALSARSDVLSESLAREAGFGAFLRKPVEPERLREVLIDREGIGFS